MEENYSIHRWRLQPSLPLFYHSSSWAKCMLSATTLCRYIWHWACYSSQTQQKALVLLSPVQHVSSISSMQGLRCRSTGASLVSPSCGVIFPTLPQTLKQSSRLGCWSWYHVHLMDHLVFPLKQINWRLASRWISSLSDTGNILNWPNLIHNSLASLWNGWIRTFWIIQLKLSLTENCLALQPLTWRGSVLGAERFPARYLLQNRRRNCTSNADTSEDTSFICPIYLWECLLYFSIQCHWLLGEEYCAVSGFPHLTVVFYIRFFFQAVQLEV